jgi:adenylate kinase
MRIIVTGQSGLGKGSFMEKVKKYAESKGKGFHYESMGKVMLNKLGGRLGEHNILNLPKLNLDLLRSIACEFVLRTLGKGEPDFFVVNTHAVFRWQHGLFPCLDLEFVKDFNPDLMICMIDDVLSIKQGLRDRKTDIFNLWELFAWREEEIWLSKFIAESVGRILNKKIPFYLFPKEEGSEVFFNLISRNDIDKVYLSFPITGIKDEERPEIEKFKSTIKKNFIVFDPFAIKDRELTVAYNTLEDEIKDIISKPLEELPKVTKGLESVKWELHIDDLTPLALTRLKFSCDLMGRELLSVMETIDSQIVSRDYMLIDQSDCLIMHIREHDGNPQVSAGCQSELIHGYQNGKPIYVIYRGGERKLSPFVTQYSKLFLNVDNCLDFLINKK